MDHKIKKSEFLLQKCKKNVVNKLFGLHCRFDHYYTGQIYGGDFAKFLCPSHKTSTLAVNFLQIYYFTTSQSIHNEFFFT